MASYKILKMSRINRKNMTKTSKVSSIIEPAFFGTSIETHYGTVNITQPTLISTTGKKDSKSSLVISQPSTIVTTGKKVGKSSISITAQSVVTVTGKRDTEIHYGTISISQPSTIVATGIKNARASPSISQLSGITVIGKKVSRSSILVSNTPILTVTGKKVGKVSILISQPSSLIFTNKKIINKTVPITSISNITTTGKKTGRSSIAINQSLPQIVLSNKKVGRSSTLINQLSQVVLSGKKIGRVSISINQPNSSNILSNKVAGGEANSVQYSYIDTDGIKISDSIINLISEYQINVTGIQSSGYEELSILLSIESFDINIGNSLYNIGIILGDIEYDILIGIKSYNISLDVEAYTIELEVESVNIYTTGSTVTFTAQFKNEAGELTSPDDVVLRIYDSYHTQIGSDMPIAPYAVGKYRGEYTLSNDPGTYYYEFAGKVGGKDIKERDIFKTEF